ncbi:Notchless protein 1 [Orchesella cincta]|uniref:Notchless protein 1 n=1 Tax=Orchesella cincta TaxID=48709 RepID=A0A1D2MVC2_ORCCI|nr:Notchless protein 1 [Orchesella cincta]
MTKETEHIQAQFVSEGGEPCGSQFDLPVNITVEKLRTLCNSLLDQDETLPCTFFVNEKEIKSSLEDALTEEEKCNTEKVVQIVYQPQAVFKVRAITRCTSSLAGHSEPVVVASFSPDGRRLASGSGDTTVRFWDLNTETPEHTCKGHLSHVEAMSWSPLGTRLASGCKKGVICIWDPENGKQVGKSLTGHTSCIMVLCWEPLHLNGQARHLASGSMDKTVRIWDTILGQTLRILSSHTEAVSALRWGGTGLIYSGSRDKTIKVWRSVDGVFCRNLEGHAHWINCLALNTDYVIRTGDFEPAEAEKLAYIEIKRSDDPSEVQKKALERYESVRRGTEERLVSGSDDNTLIIWLPEKDKKPLIRMTGHQQPVIMVSYSPDGRYIASASFDHHVKIWDGKTGKFVASLFGHLRRVYQVAWSADSRMLVSGSSDSTLKVWNMAKKGKADVHLPGHADEVYTVDWSPDGQRVVSGGKDKLLRIWRA